MSALLKIDWQSVPLETEVILKNNLLEVALYCRAMALLFTDKRFRSLDNLVKEITEWAKADAEIEEVEVRKILVATMKLPSSALCAVAEVPAIKTRAKQVKAVAPSAPLKWITKPELESLIQQRPRQAVRIEYEKAYKWYNDRSIPLSLDAFTRWLDRAKSQSAQPGVKVEAEVCNRCNGSGFITEFDNGIPVPVQCNCNQ